MSAPGGTWIAAGGVTTVGLVADAAGADPTVIGVVVATVGLVMSVFRLTGALQVGLAHRVVLDQESAKAIGVAMGSAIGEALAKQRHEGRELAAAADRLRRAVRALPDAMKAQVAEEHHDLRGAMDDTRDALGPWEDSPSTRG